MLVKGLFGLVQGVYLGLVQALCRVCLGPRRPRVCFGFTSACFRASLGLGLVLVGWCRAGYYGRNQRSWWLDLSFVIVNKIHLLGGFMDIFTFNNMTGMMKKEMRRSVKCPIFRQYKLDDGTHSRKS